MELVAATMAEAEFTFEYVAEFFTVWVVVDSCFFVLLMVTVVQSWQSGALCSGLLYLFFDMTVAVAGAGGA